MQSEVETLGALSAPTTDQLNADDLFTGPRVFTVTKVTRGKGNGKGKGDQPVNIHLAEHPHPWRPAKTVRRLLMDAWGDNPTKWPDGLRVELYRDPSVRFGGDVAGGIRVAAMSHLPRDPFEHLATLTRGQRVTWKIRLLGDRQASTPKPQNAQAALDNAVRLFGEIGVTVDELEMLVGSERAAWGPSELAQLRTEYAARRKSASAPKPEQTAPAEPDADAGECPNIARLEAIAEERDQDFPDFLRGLGWTKPASELTEADAERLLASRSK